MMQTIKDLSIFSFELIFFIVAYLKKLWQSIHSCICFVLVIIDLKIVLKKLLGPADLLKAQVFCIYKTM